jgi:exonuclease SbcC
MELLKVNITNFQSHKESELEFTDGVNVIIGPSDAGKSAIFRAIYWVITNRPLGDSFRSYWGGDTRVDLHFDDVIISRLKGDSDNQYIITNESPLVLKAFGTDTPEEVVKLLSLDDINIQSQIDPPFLLANTPGEVAQLLNKAASIDDIDKAMSNLKSYYNETKRSKTYLEKQIIDIQEELQQYDNLPELEKLVDVFEHMVREAEMYIGQYDRLSELVDRIYNVQDELSKFKDVDNYLSLLNEALTSLEELNLIKGRVKQISDLVTKIKNIETSIIKTEKTIEQLEKEYKELAPETCPLCGNPMQKEILV